MMREGTQRSGVTLRAVVDVTDCVVHLVTDEQMAAGRHGGRYLAVCGHVVASASLTTPESGYCRSCRRWRAGA